MSDGHEEHHEQPSGEPGGAGYQGAEGYWEQYDAPVWPPPPASRDPYAPGGGYASAAGPYSPGGAGADERGGWGAQSGAWSGGPRSPGGHWDPWGTGGAAGPPPGGGWSGGWGGGWQPPPPRPPRPPSGARRTLGALAAGLIILAAAALGVGLGHGVWTPGASNASSSQSPGRYYGGSPFFNGNSGSGNSGNSGNSGSATGQGGPSNVSAIAGKISPALVDVNSTFNYQQARGAGTGVVLTSDGEVLTNNHVVNGATSISVTDVGNHKTYSADVVGYDSTHDIAVLQLKNASGLATATVADSSKVSRGQPVVAVGNAGGTGGTPSSAGGSVTALNQAITASDELDGSQEHLSGLIETNAKIQSGDSGGSLVNTAGQVIGIDTAGAAGYTFQNSSGQGYAIPINAAMNLAKQIEAGKGSSTVHVGPTAFLGVMIQSSSSGQGSSNGGFGNSGFGNSGGSGNSGSGNSGSGSGNSGSGTSGATIANVVNGGAAQKAGLGAGDVITSFDGHSVSSPTDLSKFIVPLHPGDKVPVAWTDSSGQTHTGTVILGSGPPA